MQKIEILWGYAADATGEFTTLLPSWWGGGWLVKIEPRYTNDSTYNLLEA